MSVESVELFVKDVRNNASLEVRLSQVIGLSAIVRFANEHGYPITESDMQAYVKGHDGPLAEAELDGAVGGAGPPINSFRWGLHDKFP